MLIWREDTLLLVRQSSLSVGEQHAYIMRLALSAGIGGLLFGYDTGSWNLALDAWRSWRSCCGPVYILPESPRWLYRKNRVDEARAILEKIYPENEVEDEMRALHESIKMEKAEEGDVGDGIVEKLKGAFSNPVVRRGLYAGITVQVAQQFVGINTVMYYSPTIVQFAGFD